MNSAVSPVKPLNIWTEQDFAEHSGVPRGTLSDFSQWYGLLRKWNARINLVASKEVDQFWRRHAYDLSLIHI